MKNLLSYMALTTICVVFVCQTIQDYLHAEGRNSNKDRIYTTFADEGSDI